MAELIADCASLPAPLQPHREQAPEPREAPPWKVGDECVVCIAGIDEYGC